MVGTADPTAANWPHATRLGLLLRGARILGLLLSVSGCAVESPRPPAVIVPSPPSVAAPEPALIPAPIISRFGERASAGGPRLWQHAGIDIRGTTGTPVIAAADGIVVRTGTQPLAGRLVVVGHADDLATVYYHLAEIAVVTRQALLRGEILGRVGMTGNATTPHLHFGVCRRESGLCGDRIDLGWDDPARHWVSGSPCFAARRLYAGDESLRLTYPIPCSPPHG